MAGADTNDFDSPVTDSASIGYSGEH